MEKLKEQFLAGTRIKTLESVILKHKNEPANYHQNRNNDVNENKSRTQIIADGARTLQRAWTRVRNKADEKENEVNGDSQK